MGTKKKLAPIIASYIKSNCKDGAFLDLFSGMCSVGNEVAISGRQVWTNDAQNFAYKVATQFFTSQELPNNTFKTLEEIKKEFDINFQYLSCQVNYEVNYEKELLKSKNTTSLIQFETSIRNNKLKVNSSHSLFSQIYSCTYIGIHQAMEIDSLKFAFDNLLTKNIITLEQYNWYLIALGQALGKSTTSTGHFAQYLGLKDSNKNYFCNQRKKSIYKEWLNALDAFIPINTKNWRKHNLTFNPKS